MSVVGRIMCFSSLTEVSTGPVALGDFFYDSALPDTEIPNPQLGILSPTGNLISPIGDIINNWVFSSVSPLVKHQSPIG